MDKCHTSFLNNILRNGCNIFYINFETKSHLCLLMSKNNLSRSLELFLNVWHKLKYNLSFFQHAYKKLVVLVSFDNNELPLKFENTGEYQHHIFN